MQRSWSSSQLSSKDSTVCSWQLRNSLCSLYTNLETLFLMTESVWQGKEYPTHCHHSWTAARQMCRQNRMVNAALIQKLHVNLVVSIS